MPLLVPLIADEVSNTVRLSMADNGDISPKALYPFDNISNFNLEPFDCSSSTVSDEPNYMGNNSAISTN